MTDRKQIIRRIAILCLILLGGVYEITAHAADIRKGAKLYNSHCAGCHGASGQGGSMPGTPNFRRGEGLFQPDAKLLELLQNGRGVKPAYRGLMTTKEMLDVIAYLRTLN